MAIHTFSTCAADHYIVKYLDASSNEECAKREIKVRQDEDCGVQFSKVKFDWEKYVPKEVRKNGK